MRHPPRCDVTILILHKFTESIEFLKIFAVKFSSKMEGKMTHDILVDYPLPLCRLVTSRRTKAGQEVLALITPLGKLIVTH